MKCQDALRLTQPATGMAISAALTGDIKGAKKDFQFFVERTDNKKWKARRQNWIETLNQGKNLFSEEVLKEMRGE